MKKFFPVFCMVLAVIAGVVVCSGCIDTGVTDTPSSLQTETQIFEVDEFMNVPLNISIDGFLEQGFAVGDSVDVTVGSLTLYDLPVYDGYFGRRGDEEVVLYPGNPRIILAAKDSGFINRYDVQVGDSVTIVLNTSGRYNDFLENYSLIYSDNLSDFPDTESFINAHEIQAGNMKPGILYRSASVSDNSRLRAQYAADYAQDKGIRTVVSLSQTDADMKGLYDSMPEWTQDMYDSGNIFLLKLSADYYSDAYGANIRYIVEELPKYQAPYLVQCLEGIERSGFVSLVIESLCGASFEEMKQDYLGSFQNYLGIDEQSKKYLFLYETRFIPMMERIAGVNPGDSLDGIDWADASETYLLSLGLTAEQIETFRNVFC